MPWDTRSWYFTWVSWPLPLSSSWPPSPCSSSWSCSSCWPPARPPAPAGSPDLCAPGFSGWQGRINWSECSFWSDINSLFYFRFCFCFVLFQIFYSDDRMAACCVMLLRWQSREHSHLVVNTLAFIQATLQASERILGFGVQSGSEASPSLLEMIAIIQWRTGTYK